MVTMAGNQFYMPAPAWTTPIVDFKNGTGTGRLTFTGNRITDQLGTTEFLKIAADDYHVIHGNSFVGSIANFPASKSAGVYQSPLELFYGTSIAVGGRAPTRAFSALGTVTNGLTFYCSDCTIASPCASGGTGAYAKGIAGAWVCN
jgi:hypothetical protein